MGVRQHPTRGWGYSHKWTDLNGKKHQKQEYHAEWGKNKANAAYKEFVRSIEFDVGIYDNMTFQKLYEEYMAYKKSRIKERSYRDITIIYDSHIAPTFKDMELKNINLQVIQKWQNSLLTKKYTKGGKDYTYSTKTLRTIQGWFKAMLDYAVQFNYINRNPFTIDFIQANKSKVKTTDEIQIWTIDEYNQFEANVDNPIYKLAYRLLYWGGFRIGELIALRISDYNYETKSIIVNKQYDAIHKKDTTPKTENSYREVFLDATTSQMLEDMIKIYKQERGYKDSRFLVGGSQRISNTTTTRIKDQTCEKANVKWIRIHDLRHSHVSVCIDLGFSAFDIAKRLGHTVQMVNEIYGHMFVDKQKKIADVLSSVSSK